MKLYPVIHINETKTAVDQAEKALNMGADGVYLIDHRNSMNVGLAIAPVFNEIIKNHAHAADKPYVGLNILGLVAANALGVVRRAVQHEVLSDLPSALWIDDVSAGPNPLESKNTMPQLEPVRILGGVAFKYTETATDDPECAANEVQRLEHRTDVVTTSGSATGSPPSVEKIRAMKEATQKPLAIASGVDASNIADYAGIADELLVASSLETASYSGVFVDEKLQTIIEMAHRL